MGIIDGEISTIRDEVYGEEIRTAIYTAFEKLSNGIPSSDEIYEIIEEAIGSGDVLKFKGDLADNNVFDLNSIKYHEKNPGVFTVWQRNSYYSHMPIDSDNGYYVLVDLSTGDTFVVQMLFPVDLTANGTFWVRTKISTDSNENYGWYRIGSGGVSALTVKGNLEQVTNLNTMSAAEDQGIYRIVSSWSYSGLPSGFGGSDAILKNYIFTLSSSSSTVAYRIQELSYIDGSKSWIRGKSGTATFATSDWKEVAGSGSGGTVNPQDIKDAVFYYLAHDADLNQIIANYIGEQGSVDKTTVKGWIEGYVDKDNTSDHDGQTKFNASVNALIQAALSGYSTTDRTYSSDVNQAVTGFLTANSDLSNTNKSYITDARDEYSAYNDTIKPSVADGVVGLAAFRMAIQAIKPARSGGEVENSIRSLYATTRDATKPNGWATDWANAYDLARLIRLYNTYYASGDARSELNPLTKAAIADGMLGFAAFKRTEWYPTPQMYGAYGDGQHDDKNAIQLAINANKGKTLYFPAGTYIISSTIQIDYDDPGYTGDGVYPGEHAYTDMIFDPSAVIKAANGTYLDGNGNSVNLSFPSAGMISIGSPTYHDITYAKARKRIFKGGVFDSNSSLATSIIRVSQDITDFDISDCVIMATDSTTGLAIGNSDWKKNNEFQVKSMDAYVHHITILKYKYNDTNPNNYDNNNNPKHNRASGLVIYSSDNNFDNIRIYYFKRQVKITHGSGNYFSDIHTLGLRYGEADEQSNWYSNSIYHYDTSGFHLENRSTIELDQCYVDSDNYFVYVAKEAAGSVININQCTHLQYGGDKNDNSKNTGVGRTMTAFHLGCEDYSNANSVANGKVSQLFIDGFFMAPRSAYRKNSSGTAPDEVVAKGEHTGIFISSNVANGEYFEKQMRTTNMSIKRIRIDNPNKLREGDPLRGAMSGEKGTVMLPLTPLNRNGTTLHSNWYRIGVIPVGYIDGSYSAINSYKGVINYRVTLWIDECFIEFPLTIGRFSNVSNNVHLYIGHGGSNTINTDSPKSYEIAFTNVSSGSLGAYAMWIRLLNGATSASSTYSAKQVQRVHFESNYEVTPAPYGSGTASVDSIGTLSTRVLLRDMKEGKTSPCIRLNCSGKTWSLTDMAK